MSTFIDAIKDHISEEVLGQLSSALNLEQNKTKSAVSAFLPTILSGIIKKGSTEAGASSLIQMITENNLGESFLSNFGAAMDSQDQRNSLANLGGALAGGLFGSKQDNIIDKLKTFAGISKSSSSNMLKMLTPLVLSYLGKQVKNNNLNPTGLRNALLGEQKNVLESLPLGFADLIDERERIPSPIDSAEVKPGFGLPRWIVPALIALALLFLLYRTCTSQKDVAKEETTETERVEKDNVSMKSAPNGVSSDERKSIQSLKLDAQGNLINADNFIVYTAEELSRDADGNIIDAEGRILVPAAKIEGIKVELDGKNLPVLSVDADGNLVDAEGNVVYKKGEYHEEDGYYVDNEGKRIGFLGKIGKAIGDAAEATVGAFKDVFSGIFSKDERVGSTYTLSRIEFNPGDHRISYYSKPEFEALIATLSEYPDAKLDFRVYTRDGKNERENKELSSMRANVIRDMAVTLGIDKKQVKFSGMGSSDEAKADKNEVEIFIEQ